MADLTVVRAGKEILKMDRSDLADVHHTPEGITLVFKNGIIFSYSDMYMPSYAKEIIRNSINSITNAAFEINLSDYNHPIKAKL